MHYNSDFAFPSGHSTSSPRGGPIPQRGMTLLDWFAGRALAALCEHEGPKSAAKDAYAYALAMVEERDKHLFPPDKEV